MIELAIHMNRMRIITGDTRYIDYCSFCSRHTDHFGEHDDEIQLGLARYDEIRMVWTNSDGRTVHRSIDRDIIRTDLARTTLGQDMLGVLHAAWNVMWDEQSRGVSLTKPVGFVQTVFGDTPPRLSDAQMDAALKGISVTNIKLAS